MPAAQAARAQFNLLRFSVNLNRGSLDGGKPAPFSVLLGMAYPMANVYRFATDIAFISQIVNSFFTSDTVQLFSVS